LATCQVKGAGSGSAWAVVLAGLWTGVVRRLLSDGVPRQPILSGLRCAEKVIQRTVAQVRVSK
jgi:hypothetical protein